MFAPQSSAPRITPRPWGWLLELKTDSRTKFFALIAHPGGSKLVTAVPVKSDLKDFAVSSLFHLSDEAHVYESPESAALELSTLFALKNIG